MALPAPKGLTMQGSPAQLHSSLGCPSPCHGGKCPLPGQPLSPLPALSPGALSYLQHCHPVSPHPAWLCRDAVKGWGCPLLITHRGAEAFIVGKALLAHSIPVASARASAQSLAVLSPLFM